jgi:hypothetical protein
VRFGTRSSLRKESSHGVAEAAVYLSLMVGDYGEWRARFDAGSGVEPLAPLRPGSSSLTL